MLGLAVDGGAWYLVGIWRRRMVFGGDLVAARRRRVGWLCRRRKPRGLREEEAELSPSMAVRELAEEGRRGRKQRCVAIGAREIAGSGCVDHTAMPWEKKGRLLLPILRARKCNHGGSGSTRPAVYTDHRTASSSSTCHTSIWWEEGFVAR